MGYFPCSYPRLQLRFGKVASFSGSYGFVPMKWVPQLNDIRISLPEFRGRSPTLILMLYVQCTVSLLPVPIERSRFIHSTIHALISITDKIRDALDNKSLAIGVFIDFQKAFDTVNHEILLNKLDHYGIRDCVNEWCKSCLEDRKQYVSIDGFKAIGGPGSFLQVKFI